MDLRKIILSFFFLILPISGFTAEIQTLQKEEVDSYIEELSNAEGNNLVDVAGRITRSGLTDKRLFDKVKDILVSKHQKNITTAKKDEMIIHQIVNLLRTLASSGNAIYNTTLRKILKESKNRAIRNRAKHLINKIPFYHEKNYIMNQLDSHTAGQSLHTTRLLNLLNNENLIMNRFAAEEIVREGAAEIVIQEWIEQRLKQQLREKNSNLQTDTLAWYCKVLGTVNMTKYSDFLIAIAKDKSIDYKIRKHTKIILEDNGPDRWNK